MAFRKNKSEVLAIAAKMANPVLKTFRGSVCIRDGRDNVASEVEIYCASNMRESGIISAMNQSSKYKKWLGI